MKKIFLPFLTLFLITIVHGQSIWFSLDSTSSIPKMDKQGIWTSSDAVLAAALNQNNVLSIEQALSNSKNPDLKKVVEIKCNNCDFNQLTSDLNRSSSISGVEPGPNYQTLLEPNDYNLEFSEDYALDLIHAQDAWDISTGNSEVVLAISDQNFHSDHEELVDKWVYYNSNNTLDRSHGTAVAITAAGNTDNNVGKSSIGFNCNLALYRMNYNELLEASYAGYRVINASWSSSCSYNKYAHEAMIEIVENGSIIVASAGNGGTCGGASNLVYPAAFDEVFSVTSVGPNDNHERTIGDSTSTHQHNSKVDLSAPGYDLALSSAPGFYTTSSGSSFAAPYVTGTIGLMLSQTPCLTVFEIESILKSTADSIDQLNPNYAGLIGAGRLNAGRALEKLVNYPLYEVTAPDSVYLFDSVLIMASIANGYKCEWQMDCGNGYETLLEDSKINFLEDGSLKINSVSTDYNLCNFRCIVLSDSFTCTDTSVVLQLNIIDTLSNGLNNYSRGISVLPNPVNEQLRITGLQIGDVINLFNPEGKCIYSFTTSSDNIKIIEMGKFSQGVYVVSIERKGFPLLREKIIHF